MPKKKELKPSPSRHPDDPYIDEARIKIVERYKMSHLSGDEWRFSFRIELMRKGKVVAFTSMGNMEYASIEMARAVNLGLGELRMDDRWTVLDHKEIPDEGFCCQPGCQKKATSMYVMKKKYDKSCSFEKPNEPGFGGRIDAREFCDQHRQRGDAGLDDGNENYICVKGKDWNGSTVDPSKVSHAVFAGEFHLKLD